MQVKKTIRQTSIVIIGLAQVIIGVSSFLFTYLFYYDVFSFQAVFPVTPLNIPLYTFLLLVFGVYSIISGMSFIQEWRENMI